MNGQTQDFPGSEAALCDTIMVGAYGYAFVHTMKCALRVNLHVDYRPWGLLCAA